MSDDRLSAVVFDVGNCLYFDPGAVPARAIHAAQAARLERMLTGWDFTAPPDLERLVAMVWGAMEEAYHVEAERRTFRDSSLAKLWQGALATEGVEVSAPQADLIWRALWLPLTAFGIELYPDTLDVLQELKIRDITIGLCTNRPCTEDMLWPDLHAMGIGRYIDAVTCSGDVGYFKPHPAPFERVLRQLRRTPDETLMVGDSLEADIAGARSIGMRTAWKLNGRYGLTPTRDVDIVIHDLNELLALPQLGGAGVPNESSPTPHEDQNEDRY